MTLRDTPPTSRAMVVAVTVSMVAFLDSSVINLALPATEHDLGGGLALQQWVIDGYLLAMAAAILPGGSISDLFGRVPVMRFGLLAFGAGSVLAAVATSPAMLITARLIQGLGAAFLVPGSLALINTVFDKAHQSAAIGIWTGWTGTAFALGPLLGGICVDFLGWRWIFVWDDRAGHWAGRDYHSADVGDAGLGADRIQRPGVGDQQRRLAARRADVDRFHRPDQRWRTQRQRIRPRVRGERGTIRRGRVVCRAVDNQSPCRVPTCALRHRGVMPRPARCATRPGQQPLGRDRNILSALIVHPGE
jgi:hypothetical protein